MCCRNGPLWEGASAKRVGEINALFCATDTIAIGAIQYCRSQGLRVPEDVMVASVGDSRAVRVAYVPLTSAHLHYRTAGDKAARLLLDQLFSNTAYTFLSILIAFSAAKVFGSNPFLGVVIGMIMIHPNLQNAWTVASEGVQTYQPVFGGLYSIPLVGYQGHVIPVIIAVGLMSQIEKRLHKVVPAMFDLFVTPLVSVFVTGYLTLAVIGPIFTTVEDGIINGVQALIQLPYGIGSFVMGGLYAITVVAGIHHMYTLIDVGQLAKFGYTYWLPLASAANVAQMGV